MAIRALKQWTNRIYPVHPTEKSIEGFDVFAKLSDLPLRPDLLTVYLSESRLLGLMEEIESLGAGEIWLNPGADSEAVLRELMKHNLPFRKTCTIIEAGSSPSQFTS